ncbi:MAG: response regulator transcription factor [Myxococcales bacterium]|nr:response regulator transcription factor [Myxococcales bacterium]
MKAEGHAEEHEILIIEDDEAIATGLAMNLKLEGHRTRLVHDGADVMAMLEQKMPDLVLLDITLPNKDGLTILDEIRSAGLEVPVIVLSARVGEYDKVAALRLGADDYVTKPFALAELLARVQNHDYQGFFAREIREREAFRYPPLPVWSHA